MQIENCVLLTIANQEIDWRDVMLVEKMYVRCPADKESMTDPRVFVCGQITKVDQFKKTVKVRIYDPLSYLMFFENLPKGEIEIPKSMAQRCTFFLGSSVFAKNRRCKVLSCVRAKDQFYYYYLQDEESKEIFRQCEKNIVAAFNNGRVDPTEQLKRYEFQNPCWYLGHSIVSKSMNVLDNSIYGFKELAGSKIYLLPHQVNSIMRCLQEEPCRYMLADEVGMGKTIEAISVFKIYELQGGAVLEQRQSLMQKRAQIQTEIAQNAELLVGMAATELPIFLVRDLVSQIKLQAEDEHNDFIMQQALEQMDDYLSDFEMQYPESIEASRIFVDYVRKQTEADLAPRLYEMSDHALFQMNDLVENTLQQSVNNTKSLLVNKADLKKQLDTVESYLTLDIDEKDLTAIYDQIKAKEADLVEAQVEYNRLQQERSYINSTVITKSAEYSRDIEIFLQKLELHDDSERMMKYSNIALRILEAYAVELQRRKTGTLGATITKCYKQLANKKNLIQEIVMNPETLDMQYLDENGNEVSKESLSAGEKQLMIIAILWALALCSKKKLPVIIDTPLSRLDSQHRTSIISTYFPNASDQTIILSTDTEIDQNYYEMMKNSVGDEFTLVYSEETKSTSIKKGYFQEL